MATVDLDFHFDLNEFNQTCYLDFIGCSWIKNSVCDSIYQLNSRHFVAIAISTIY